MTQIPTKRIKRGVITIAVTGSQALIPQDLATTSKAIEELISFFEKEMEKIYIQTPYGSIPFQLLNPTFKPNLLEEK